MADSLSSIHEWMDEQLVSTSDRGVSTLQFQRDFIEKEIDSLCDRLKIKATLVTVRYAHRNDTPLLRPAYSYPADLYAYFGSPEKQKPFTFQSTTDPFGDPSVVANGTSDITGAIYDLRALASNATSEGQPDSEKTAADFTFGPRISEFINEIHSQRTTVLKTTHRSFNTVDKQRYCLVVGKTDLVPTNSNRRRFTHFLAIYFTRSAKSPAHARLLEQASKAARVIFGGMDLIVKIDTAHFRSEGLAVVAQLNQVFSEWDATPADKIAFAIERLRLLLSRRLVGVDYSKSEINAAAPNIYFVETKYERWASERVLLPTFQLYPQPVLGASIVVLGSALYLPKTLI